MKHYTSGIDSVVSNKSGHDLAIARKKVDVLPDVKTAVPDVMALKSEYFMSQCPSSGCD